MQVTSSAVEDLVDAVPESAGFSLVEVGRIVVKASSTCPDSIGIIQPGGILHFEEDRATALVILSRLNESDRNTALNSDYSLIKDA